MVRALAAVALGLVFVFPARAAGLRAGSPFAFVNIQVSHDTFKAHSEPAIAENPVNPMNLVAGSKFFTDPAHYRFKIGTFYSVNGGRSWHDDGLLPGFDSFVRSSDISFAFSPNGSIVYACVLAEDDRRSGIYVSRSRDGGKTWSQPVTVFEDDTNATFSDKPWITVDGTRGPNRGNVYVVWNLDGNNALHEDPDAGNLRRLASHVDVAQPKNGLVVSRSTDYGRTFSVPAVISQFDQPHFALGAIPAVGPDGQLSIAFLTFLDESGKTSNGMALVTSRDGGQTFSAQHTIVSHISGLPNHLSQGTFRNLSLPTFAVSPTDGSMLLAWADMRNGDADILAVHSTNRGATWSKPVRVNDDKLHNGKDQFMPEVAVAPNGMFTIAWFDRRRDAENRLIDEEISQSTNDGRSFGKNLRVTQKSWDPAIDAPLPEGRSNNTFIGDYQGLTADNTTVHPLWNDTQNGTSQEVRSAIVSERVFER